MPTPTGFAELRRLLADLPGPDAAAERAVAERESRLTKPAGSLGRLEGLVRWLAAWQGRHPPGAERVRIVVFAGNHGVVAQGVSAYPAAVTAQMVANFERGGAAINQLAGIVGAELRVEALDLETPTVDFTTGAAMSESACVAAIARGMAAVEAGLDLLVVGEMGIGNTTAAAALAHALFGGTTADWAGRGTGIDDAGLARKIAVLDAAKALHGAHLADPFEALRRVGGRELAGVAGAVLQARRLRVPVLLDGYVTTAAAAVLERARAGALDHCRLGHCSAEAGHARLAAALGLEAILDLGMRLGEGSGAALAALVVKAAAGIHAGMATFAEAGVAEKA